MSVPTHADRSTWPQCLARGCSELVDPWDHNTRCGQHRPDPHTEVARTIRWRDQVRSPHDDHR